MRLKLLVAGLVLFSSAVVAGADDALTNAVAETAGLVHGMVGESHPLSDLPGKMLTRLNEMRQWVRFQPHDLEHLAVDLQDLSPFIFNSASSPLEEESLADSSLQRILSF